jgi:hypothetical protein
MKRLAAVTAMVAMWALWPSDEPMRARLPDAPTVEQAQPTRTAPSTVTRARPAAAPLPSLGGLQVPEQVAHRAHRAHFAQQAEHLRAAARYPAGASPFDAARDPITARMRLDRKRSPARGEAVLISWVDRVVSTPAAPARICARLEQGETVSTAGLSMIVYRDAEATPLAAIELTAGGCEGGAGAVLPAALIGDTRTLLRVHAVAEAEGIENQHVFQHGPRGATLTGQYSDARVPGLEGDDLQLSAEVEVQQSGRYWITATVSGPDGEAIGQTEARAELAPGTHVIPLRLAGILLCEGAVDGPYRIGNLMLMDVTTPPGAVLDHQVDAYTTAPHAASAFSCAAYTNGEMERRARFALRMGR